MEIKHLRYFLAVAREENMTKAADMLHVTQPTLSKTLRYQADQNEYVKRMSDSFIPALVDKKMISKSFADTGFSIVKNNKPLPGANTLRYIDEHHFLYEVLIDRTQMCQSFFRFYIFISGCNFQIRNTQDVIFADSREEAAKKLSRLAEFCVKLREEFGEYLSERFGDTPEWYEWDAGDC